jgi:hypothetical protein
MEGLICFFMFLRWGGTLLPRNAKLHQDFLESFFSGTMASLIRPKKYEVKWHNFVAKSGFIAESSSLQRQIFCRRKSFVSNSDR